MHLIKGKRTGPRSKIGQLTDGQRTQLRQWLDQNVIYSKISARVLSEFGIKISAATLCAHYKATFGKEATKPRIRSKIGNLAPAQREQVNQWLSENLVYSKVAARMQTEFGVTISRSALSDYYSLHCAPRKGQWKSRPGKITNLPVDQREEVYQMIRSDLRYQDIARRMQRKFGATITVGSLSRYRTCHYEEIFGAALGAAQTDSVKQ